MTDRELLELAAKAAGYEIVGIAHKFIVQGIDEDDLLVANDRGGDSVWNPITDDGDALRLACALKINVEHAETLSRKPHGVNCWPLGRGDCGHMETDLADYGAATRRAIVRAAAEIGRAVQKPLAP